MITTYVLVVMMYTTNGLEMEIPDREFNTAEACTVVAKAIDEMARSTALQIGEWNAKGDIVVRCVEVNDEHIQTFKGDEDGN